MKEDLVSCGRTVVSGNHSPSFILGLAGFPHTAGSPPRQVQIGVRRGVRTETLGWKDLAPPAGLSP